jgi:hypothetical protein
MNDPTTPARVEQACTDLTTANSPITFTAIAAATGISRATLYRNPALHAIITEHRANAPAPAKLSDLDREITHLRTALDAIASKVRHQEERIRRLERRNRSTPKH